MKKCPECPKFNSCIKMCEEVEHYVNQDYVPQRELTTGKIDFFNDEDGNKLSDWQSDAKPIPLTKREKQIVRLIAQRLNKKEICHLLEITAHSYEMILSRLKKKAKKM